MRGASEDWPCLRAGYYKDARGNGACTPCGAGKANANTASIAESACGVCDVNTFSLAGAVSCSACQSNSQSAQQSELESACECNAGYYGSTGPSCVACDPGSFKTTVENGACMECNAGDFLDATGSTTDLCEECLANTYSLAGAGTCTPCHANAVSDEKASGCTCAPGHDGTTTSGTCTACLAGNSPGPPCHESTLSHSTAWADTVAWVRSRGPAVTRCEELKGIWAFLRTFCTGRQGVRLCKAKSKHECPQEFDGLPFLRAGYYKNARGKGACTPCGAGKANADTASIAESACGVCDVNTYSLAGAGTCAPCHANAVSDAEASACICAPGYDDTTTSGTCTACLAGNSLGPPCLESLP